MYATMRNTGVTPVIVALFTLRVASSSCLGLCEGATPEVTVTRVNCNEVTFPTDLTLAGHHI